MPSCARSPGARWWADASTRAARRRNHRSPIHPKGVAGVVAAASHIYEGELLTVTESDLDDADVRAVVVIPYSRLESGDFSEIDVNIVGAPSRRNLDQLRYASRFPYGIPDAAMKAILSKMGRSAPDTARAR